MCNLYSLTKAKQPSAIGFAQAMTARATCPVSGDLSRPVRANRALQADGCELVLARWGMPGPPQYRGQPATNIRNVMSPHWRGWLGVGSRCIVLATSFCEYADTKPLKTPTWFALNEDRPLLAFAGL